MEVVIEKANSARDVPLDLLLLADPSKDQIEQYINNGVCLIAAVNNRIVGAVVIVAKEDSIFEIVNIAVEENYQGMGIGKKLLMNAVDMAMNRGTCPIGTLSERTETKTFMRWLYCGKPYQNLGRFASRKLGMHIVKDRYL